MGGKFVLHFFFLLALSLQKNRIVNLVTVLDKKTAGRDEKINFYIRLVCSALSYWWQRYRTNNRYFQ